MNAAQPKRCYQKISEIGGVELLRTGAVFPVLRTLNSAVYCFRVGRTLVDTGPPNQWKHIRAFAKTRNIRRCIVSHFHEDHAGNGGRLQCELGIPVFASQLTAERLQQHFPIEYYRRAIWGKPCPYKPNLFDENANQGHSETAVHIPMPGHSLDHAAIYFPHEKLMFTADMYVTGTPRVARFDEDMLAREIFCGARTAQLVTVDTQIYAPWSSC